MNCAQKLATLKVMEECAELIQIVSKLCMYPDGNHPSTKFDGPIWPLIADEIADARAACIFVLQKFPEVPIAGIEARTQEKLRLYEEWSKDHEAGHGHVRSPGATGRGRD